MSNVEQWEHDEQRAMENEIAILRGQVSTLTAAYENAVAQHNKTLDELRASPASAPEVRESVIEAIAETLGDVYDCTRVWSAWSCGTMSQDDFSLVAEDRSRLEEIADAAMLVAAPTPPVSEDRWLPIATAPKNEFVLLAGPSGYTTIETVFATGRMCSDYHVGRWIDHANDDLTDWGFEPTHWMPLPKAPTMQEDKKP